MLRDRSNVAVMRAEPWRAEDCSESTPETCAIASSIGLMMPVSTSSGEPPAHDTVTVTVGGVTANVLGAALASGAAGLYQVAITIPTTLANGDYPVVATVGGAQSPSSTLITVQQ